VKSEFVPENGVWCVPEQGFLVWLIRLLTSSPGGDDDGVRLRGLGSAQPPQVLPDAFIGVGEAVRPTRSCQRPWHCVRGRGRPQ
jgi:hypothetical protein